MSLHKVLVADPPWKFSDKLPGNGRGAEKHYRCLSLEEIKEFPLPTMDPNSYLFLWRVSSMQQEALDVINSWGFTLKTELVWCKLTSQGRAHFGMGRHLRAAHETCLVAVRGKPKPKNRSVRSVFYAEVGVHSQKPDAFYSLVESLTDGPYAELFARKIRPGWSQVGDQLGTL